MIDDVTLAVVLGLVLLPVGGLGLLGLLGLGLVVLGLDSVHRLFLPVRHLGSLLLGLLLGDAEVDDLIVGWVLLDGSLLQLRAGGLRHACVRMPRHTRSAASQVDYYSQDFI